MKIFFNASLTGKKEYGNAYQVIVELLEKSDNMLLPTPVVEGDPHKVAEESTDEASAYYKGLVKGVKQCDVAVFEVSYPSTGIGHEVSMAMGLGKPVIALHVKGRTPFVLESIGDDRLQVIEYELEGLKSLLEAAIEYAGDQQDSRFNFFVSPKIAAYLDWIAKSKREPRAVYLRRLIKEQMKQEQEYEG